MVKDLEILYDIAPLFEKELIIWGGGYEGRFLIREIRAMGAGKLGITVCDSDPNKSGEEIEGIEIISPYTLEEHLRNADRKNIIICIMIQNLKVQDEVLSTIEDMGVGELDIYTSFGIRCGIYYGLKSSYIDETYKQKKVIENSIQVKQEKSCIYREFFEYLAFAPLHNDEIIMVYQPDKAESYDVYFSIKQYGKNVTDIYPLQNVKYIDSGIQKIINKKSGKIISLVSNPISGILSYMWNNIDSFAVHGSMPNMMETEICCFDCSIENFQEKWYDNQMKKLVGIDVLEYPFDRDKGYQIIRSGNIELLLLKTECLDELGSVIGNFLGIQDFHFYHADYEKDKPYRFAYKEYMKKFSISSKILETIFNDNKFVKHFYTEEECDKFRKQYL